MKRSVSTFVAVWLAGACLLSAASARRQTIARLGEELAQSATALANDTFERLRGGRDEISVEEQAILFRIEAFASGCRLFARLGAASSGYAEGGALRTNLFNAYSYLLGSFSELEEAMRKGRLRTYGLADSGDLLEKLDEAFADWPDASNPAYLHLKYVKAADDQVYLIERRGTGTYVRRPFSSLESLYSYNYANDRGKNPWKHLVEVEEETLQTMAVGAPIQLTFNGRMIMVDRKFAGRPVYLVRNGRRCLIGSPAGVENRGGWKSIVELPAEIVDGYPEGDPVD